MSSLRISGRSGDYVLIDDKFIKNSDTGLYLRHVRDSFVEESGAFNSGDGDFHWQVKDGKVLSYHGVVCAGDVEDEDVPVNRAAALIEAALNAKATGCGCDCGCGPDCDGCDCDCACPKPVVETPVEETPVEETPVEETPVEETPVEDEVPDLVEEDST